MKLERLSWLSDSLSEFVEEEKGGRGESRLTSYRSAADIRYFIHLV